MFEHRAKTPDGVKRGTARWNICSASINSLWSAWRNLSSLKAVEDAFIADRGRQIEALESGGTIEGETRGWTIGSTETKQLRGNESEVDCRYMPDPDLGPVVIGQDLLDYLHSALGRLPDKEIDILVQDYGLIVKDAMSFVFLNDGRRAEYFRNLVDAFMFPGDELKQAGRLCDNWALHEMGGRIYPSVN